MPADNEVTFVLMLGDNIYGGKSQQDFKRKFGLPYKPLLDEGESFTPPSVITTIPTSACTRLFNMGWGTVGR
jgi:hypothetical protein